MEAFKEGLEAERMIKVFVGPNLTEAPFLVPHTIVAQLLSDCTTPNKRVKTTSGHDYKLEFYDENRGAWVVLLYWAYNHKLPPDCEGKVLLLARSWSLGEKHQIPVFQDEVMLQLLRDIAVDSNGLRSVISVDIIREAVETTSAGSKLCTLMGRIAIELLLDATENPIGAADLEECGKVPGFTTSIFKAMEEREKDDERLWAFPDDGGVEFNKNGPWRDLMVAGGPEKHWVHEDEDEVESTT